MAAMSHYSRYFLSRTGDMAPNVILDSKKDNDFELPGYELCTKPFDLSNFQQKKRVQLAILMTI